MDNTYHQPPFANGDDSDAAPSPRPEQRRLSVHHVQQQRQQALMQQPMPRYFPSSRVPEIDDYGNLVRQPATTTATPSPPRSPAMSTSDWFSAPNRPSPLVQAMGGGGASGRMRSTSMGVPQRQAAYPPPPSHHIASAPVSPHLPRAITPTAAPYSASQFQPSATALPYQPPTADLDPRAALQPSPDLLQRPRSASNRTVGPSPVPMSYGASLSQSGSYTGTPINPHGPWNQHPASQAANRLRLDMAANRPPSSVGGGPGTAIPFSAASAASLPMSRPVSMYQGSSVGTVVTAVGSTVDPTAWEPIVARQIKTFAVYFGDLYGLLKRVTRLNCVDLLVVSAEEVGSLNPGAAPPAMVGSNRGGQGRGGKMSAATPSSSGKGNLPYQPVGLGAGDDTGSSSGRPLGMTRTASSSSISNMMMKSMRFNKSASQPQLSSTSSLNLTDAEGLAVEADMLIQRLVSNFKRVVVSVNVGKLYAEYEVSAKRIGSSFSKFFVAYLLAHVVEFARFPVSGFLLYGLEGAAERHPSGDAIVAKLVGAIRAEKELSGPGGKKGYRSIFLDQRGVNVWDKVRDDINGIFFTNNVVTERGTFRARFGPERVEFDEISNKLKIEITLRDDFLVCGIEASRLGPDRLDAALVRYAINWHRGLGFLFWFCHSLPPSADGPRLSQTDASGSSAAWDTVGRNVEDVRPPKLLSLSDDSIFELAVHASSKALKQEAESAFLALREGWRRNGCQAYPGGPITPQVWSTLLDRPMPDATARFVAGIRRMLDFVNEMHFEDVVYERVDTLAPGLASAVVPIQQRLEDAGGRETTAEYRARLVEVLADLPANLVRNLARLYKSSQQPGTPNSRVSRLIAADGSSKRSSKRASFLNVPGTPGSATGTDDDAASVTGSVGEFGESHMSNSLTALVMGLASQSSEAKRGRMAVLLKRNLNDLASKKLLASLKKNVDVESNEPTPKYVQVMEALKEVLKSPTLSARWVLESVAADTSDRQSVRGLMELRALVMDLKEGLEDGTVNVWLAAKAAFLTGSMSDGNDEPGRGGDIGVADPGECVWGFAEVKSGTVHVYVADHAPNVAEVVLHAFAKLVLGWGTGRCLVAEALLAAQTNTSNPPTFPVPSRVVHEVELRSHSGRLGLIRDMPSAIDQVVRNPEFTAGEASYLAHLAKYISSLAEQSLIDKQAYEDLPLSWARMGYAPSTDLERMLTELVGKCTFDAAGAKRFLSVVETLRELLRTSPALSAETHALCLLYMALQKAIRRCAYMELQVSLINKNALFLPDADQVAVGLEMTTTQSNIRGVFELTSLQLATPMHDALRQMAFADLKAEPAAGSGALKHRSLGAAEAQTPKKKKGLLGKGAGENEAEGHAAGHKKRRDEGNVMEKKITNAYLFIYPILIDLILVRLLGSGIFYSDRMNPAVQYSITLVFLVMFPLVGGVMNSIGRTVTYYFYQKSIPLMIAAFIRRLAAGIVVGASGSLIVAGIDYYYNRFWVTAVLTFLYSMGFTLYMIFLCGLVSFKDPEDYFFKSPGPRIVILTIPILSISGFISRFVFKDTSRSTIVWGIYCFMLLLTVFYMAWNYRRIAITYINWPDMIEVTAKNAIVELYAKEASARPKQEDNEDAESFERRKRRWERSAVEWWMERLEKVMASKKVGGTSSEPAIIRKRLAQRRWEDMLMKWYFERTGSTPPKRYSNEWDIALKQALGELKKKYNVEKLNRGDILFDFESPAIVFGFFYFIIIFVDKWCVLFVTGRAALFLPSEEIGKSYVSGVLYGTVFLLVSSGILELTLSFIYEKQKAIIQKALWQAKSLDRMVADHWAHIRSIYRSELKRFLLFTFTIFVLVTIPVVIFNRDNNTLIIYGATVFGYFGLLVGLFHKLFITADERLLNRWMFFGMVVSIVTICVLLRLTRNMLWAAGTITLNGWLFGIACVVTYSKETLATVHYRITISPTLTSSGQRVIGYVQNEGNEAKMSDLAKRLLENQARFSVVLPTSDLGRRLIRHIQTTVNRVAMLPQYNLLNVAFPSARALADSIVARFNSRSLVVHIIPARIEIDGVPFHGISTTRDDVLHIFFEYADADGQWTDDDVAILSECLLHEAAEEMGMSHSDACAIEALASLGEDITPQKNVLKSWVPLRIQKYLSNAAASTGRRLANNTKTLVSEKANLCLKIDEIWAGEECLSHEDRLFVVRLAKKWDIIFSTASKASFITDEFTLPSSAPFVKLRSGSDQISPAMALARSLIAAILAMNVKEACDNKRGGFGNRFRPKKSVRRRNRLSAFIGTLSRTASQKENEEFFVEDMLPGSISRKKHIQLDPTAPTYKVQAGFVSTFVGIFIDAVVALFLSMTADVRFGRELAVTPWLIRGPLALVFFISRKLVGTLNQIFIYRKVPSIAQILSRNERGIFRILTLNRSSDTGRIQLSRVDAFNSASQTIVSTVEKPGNEEPPSTSPHVVNPKADLVLLRYTGPKAASWQPGDKDKPQSRGFFTNVSQANTSRNSHRLIHENFYDGSGAKVVRKHIYEYPDEKSLFPQQRKVYLIEYNGDRSSSFLSEIHVFSNVAWYSVQSASIKRMHKPSKKYIHIYAEYPDASIEGPQRIFYKSKYPQEWTLVLKSTGSITTDAAPNFAFAEFSRNGEDGFYRTIFDYSHPQHPTMTSVYVRKNASRRMDLATHNDMNLSSAMSTDPGDPVATPIEILEDHFGLLSLAPPTDFHLSSELADAGFKARRTRHWSIVPPFVRSVQVEYLSGPCATVRKREDLWTAWRAGKVPGVFAREIDERFLRAEPILSSYWRFRDLGNVHGARAVLSEQKQVLDVCLKVPDRPVTRTHLKIRFSDLYMLGVGGDAHQVFSFDDHSKNTEGDDHDPTKTWGATLGRLTFGRTLPFASAQVQKRKNDGNRLNVMNVDSGTWPTGGGGVGSCRRDLIDGLSRIRWNTIAEIGSAEAVQKDYQIERNIDSITYVVLWDVDFGTPNENVYRTENQRQLRRKQRATTDRVIREVFVPLVEKLIEGCFKSKIPAESIEEYEQMFVNFYHFFQMYDWTSAWNHVETQKAWIQGWLKGGEKRWKNGELHDLETPTLQQIDILFGLITRLMLPLTVKLSKIPVVHASHHGIQAIIGVVAKKIHGSGLVVWDHGILWRERLFGLCGDGMPRFTQCGFIGISRLVARIVFARADFITPCTSIQNVDWEAWIGGGKHRSQLDTVSMGLKINPVLNGMDLSKFSVKRHLELEGPTAVMLSHISPVKDIMNAIGAANYIVNEFKLTSYRLKIYGSPEKEPPYTTECQAAIANMNLGDNVNLMGLGSPSAVLPTGWIFVNSSITEGLPLALGEAGLCGLPVACTDVGGSREVVSNLAKNEVYGAIVPPSKPRQLAIAQLKILAMTDGLSRVADSSTDVEEITLDDLVAKGPEQLERRIMDEKVKDLRRKLGLRLRERTIAVFSIARYLREHEQILWCANYKAKVN
ncbi:hypothetical protein HDU96_003954 [Phlyctochytrium bullatum]|nr:hypothetical protein HDU96_003954 [Phlyctochytrium bullatum]